MKDLFDGEKMETSQFFQVKCQWANKRWFFIDDIVQAGVSVIKISRFFTKVIFSPSFSFISFFSRQLNY